MFTTDYDYTIIPEFIKVSKEFKNRDALKGIPEFVSEKLVIDELVSFVVPAVKLSYFLTDLLRLMLSSKLSHGLEVYLTSCRANLLKEL